MSLILAGQLKDASCLASFSIHSDKLISCTNHQVACEAGKCPKSAGEAILKRDFPANTGDLATMTLEQCHGERRRLHRHTHAGPE